MKLKFERCTKMQYLPLCDLLVQRTINSNAKLFWEVDGLNFSQVTVCHVSGVSSIATVSADMGQDSSLKMGHYSLLIFTYKQFTFIYLSYLETT